MRLIRTLRKKDNVGKHESERHFWCSSIKDCIDWYDGRIDILYGAKRPTKQQKIVAPNKKDSALLTWLELHQKPKYLEDLRLKKNVFKGETILDVGAGPLPSALAFEEVDLYCLDPLYAEYLADDFPVHYYPKTRFINASAEDIPIESNFFDAVISVNAIDHVDNFHKTAQEIRRVLKPKGKLAMHVHYHKPTKNEPIELNDKIMLKEYGWCKGLRKIGASHDKLGWKIPKDELYVIWRNF